MSLSVGARLGPYEVLGVIGAGGMGEVYRAHDTNLHRDVAIKVLPEAMAGNPKRLLRFEREARALAALNHPNIASVYGIEEAPHGRAIVMELVEGENLSVRIRRGPVAIADALPLVRQVAEALAAAHEAGIVHRDLKPANIKVREDGTVKVLDFGLAKGGSGDSASGSGSGSSDLAPTLTIDADMTQDGAVLGTAAYMAPEQALGTRVDKRADIWAFGVVFFEMLAGRRPFDADDLTEPAWNALPADTPPSIRRLLVRCLTRDRKQRLHDIADARLEIDEAIAPRLPDAVSRERHWARRWAPAPLWLLAGVAIGVAVWRMPTAAPLVTHARLDVSPASELSAGGVHQTVVLPSGGARTALAWSPDGRTLAFIGITGSARQVYLRDLTSDTARPLAGTEGARVMEFSPNGDELAFWADGAIRKVNFAGGPASKICDALIPNGITWGATRMVFGSSPWLSEVSPAGGAVRLVTDPTGLVRHASPFLLPQDAALLYTEHEKQWTSGDERVMVLPLVPGSAAKVLLRGAADARYLTTGHLAFMRQGTLFVVQFDARTLELRGEPVAVVKDVAQAVVGWDSDDLTLAGQFAISPQGTLAYVSSPLPRYPDGELVAVDRKGRVASLGAPVRGYRNHLALSPDGTRIAVSINTATDVWVFLYDLVRGSLSRFAQLLTGEVILGAWSKDNQIAVGVVDEGKISATFVRPDSALPTVPVADSTGFWPSSISPEGRLVGMHGGDIWIYSPNTTNTTRTVLQTTTPISEVQPMWSPDGRWLAYTSNTTGRSEVYVKAFPEPGEAIMVSTNGANSPGWNPSGRELFYIEPGAEQDRMMAVPFAVSGLLGKGAPLFSFPRGGLFLGTSVLTPYAVGLDGQRFYTVRQPPRTTTPVTQIHLILNWFEELKTQAPSGK